MNLSVVVHPNSKNPRVEKDLTSVTHIYIREPALEGRANSAVVRALSELYKISKSDIKLVSGTRSKCKVFEVGSNKPQSVN